MLTCGLVALIVEMRWAIYIHAMRVASLIGCKLKATRRIVDWTRFYYEITGMAKARLMWPTDLRRRP